MISKPQLASNFQGLKSYQDDVYNNLGIEDMKPAGVLTEAPTTGQLNLGQFRLIELSGVPWLYYKTLAGVLYKMQMTAV